MDRDPMRDARDLVMELFPQARWALLTGSVITSQRTAGSDLDIVVLLPDHDPQAPHRDSRRYRGWPVELFVHDEQSLTHYLGKDRSARRPSLYRMVAIGVPLIGDPNHWQAQCAVTLAVGPAPLTQAERDRARYELTDLLDDLVHATDRGEHVVIATTAWTTLAEHALVLTDHWTGGGKWLLRELRDFDHDFADRRLAAHGDVIAIETLIREVLSDHGGPLFDGYHAAGERPAQGRATTAENVPCL
jgi:hypothetical protein